MGNYVSVDLLSRGTADEEMPATHIGSRRASVPRMGIGRLGGRDPSAKPTPSKEALRFDAKQKHKLLVECEQQTNFGYQELRVLLDMFEAACDGKDTLSFAKFSEVLPELFGDELVGRSVFHALDVDDDGELEFREVARALSIISGGSRDEKSNLCFSILDLDNNGVLEVSEVRTVVKRNRDAMRKLGYGDSIFGDPDELVDRLFTCFSEEDESGVSARDRIRKLVVFSRSHIADTISTLWNGTDGQDEVEHPADPSKALEDDPQLVKAVGEIADMPVKAVTTMKNMFAGESSGDEDDQLEMSDEEEQEHIDEQEKKAVEAEQSMNEDIEEGVEDALKKAKKAAKAPAKLAKKGAEEAADVVLDSDEETEEKKEKDKQEKQEDKQERQEDEDKKKEQEAAGATPAETDYGEGREVDPESDAPDKKDQEKGENEGEKKAKKKPTKLAGGMHFGKQGDHVEMQRYAAVSTHGHKNWSEEEMGDIKQRREEEQKADEAYLNSTLKHFPALDREAFLRQSANSPDIVHCFGLFPYFYSTIVEKIEQAMSFLDMDEDSLVFSYVEVRKAHHLVHRSHFAVAHGGFFSIYRQKEHDCPSEKAAVLKFVRSHTPRRVFCLETMQVCYSQKEDDVSSIHLKGGPEDDYFSIHFKTEADSMIWLQVLRNRSVPRLFSSNRFASFSPERKEGGAKWFVNAKPYFKDLLMYINAAQHEIMIAGWWVVPHILLKRGEQENDRNELGKALQERAKKGVKIYILMWKETEMGMLLGSLVYKMVLKKLHKNIVVLRHPQRFPIYWSHHQKLVIIDRCKGYVGGVDLAYMRFDDKHFRITDPEGTHFPGKDYGNLCVDVTRVGDPDEDQLDRQTTPRMPWHDIHMTVVGDSVRDLLYNFVQRWNLAAMDKGLRSALLFLSDFREFHDQNNCLKEVNARFDGQPQPGLFSANTQVVRSICKWSGGIEGVETSIYRAYLRLIRGAKHYIYIENQYFISSITASKPRNQIAKALFERISLAIENKENFRVRIIIPVFPAGSPAAIATRYVIHWVYSTISRSNNSIMEALKEQYPDVDLSDYISFFSLRNWDTLPANGSPTTEQVYIHAKLMIVDDTHAIIGSANINDRSMDGSRDSEICVVVEDREFVDSTMDGEPYQAGKFARSLRMKLTRVLLGLSKEEAEEYSDPVCAKTHQKWSDTAEGNFSAFIEHFEGIPENSFTVASMLEHGRMYTGDDAEAATKDLRERVHGYLVWFPHDFLVQENNAPTLLNPEFYIPLSVFQ